jgi:hypothetical protein
MKLKIHSFLEMLIIFALISVFSFPAWGTDVGGVIDTDTTWDSTGSPYIVTGNILVSSGVRLTIEPGVQIRFNGYYSLFIQGNIRALGTQGNEILFTSNLTQQQKGDWDHINLINNTSSELSGIILEYSSFGIMVEGGTDNKINNSVLRHIKWDALQLVGSENLFVHNNHIYDCAVESSGSVSILYGGSVIFMNNTMENVGKGIHNNDTLNLTINNVNFLGISGYSVELFNVQSGVIDGRYNYWGPETTAEMDLKGVAANIDKIYDFYDYPIYGRVDYTEWLNAPNPDAYPWTGIPPVNQAPISDCGVDQAVHDEVTLDGSASCDPDGSIVTYEWELAHRENSAYNRTASGVNPTISNLEPGFYDVTLTVTDDGALTDTDTMLLAAAGSCFCTAITMHIEAIEADLLKADKGKKHGQALVKVLDNCGNPVSGVTVYGTFSGDFTDSISGVTGGDGNVLLTTTTSMKGKPAFTFCVDDVSNGTLSYAPEDNVETCDSF